MHGPQQLRHVSAALLVAMSFGGNCVPLRSQALVPRLLSGKGRAQPFFARRTHSIKPAFSEYATVVPKNLQMAPCCFLAWLAVSSLGSGALPVGRRLNRRVLFRLVPVSGLNGVLLDVFASLCGIDGTGENHYIS